MLVQQLKVSNPSDGVVVITPDPNRPKAYLRFEAKGDEMGGDSMYVSREAAQQPDFMKAVQRGLLVVELPEDDELKPLLTPRRARKKAEKKPLTAMRVIFDENDEYKARTEQVKVTIEPLTKV